MFVRWRFGSIVAGLVGLVGCEEGATPGEDATVAPRCSATAAFGRPTTLTAFNTIQDEEQAALSPDELTMYFSRGDDTGNYDIYQATRASKSAAFGVAFPVAGVNTAAQEREPRVTADGLTMYASSRPTPAGPNDPYRITFATRASIADSFGPLQNVPVVNGTSSDISPFISADGRVLYFASNRNGSGIEDLGLYRSVQTGGTFSAPERVMGANLDTTSGDGNPVLSEDELTLYFASSRTPARFVDIFQATRATAQEPFGDPKHLSELATGDEDIPSWISADGCELYFTRYTPLNNRELAVAVRGR